MIWWVICENWLTIGFRNAFFIGIPQKNLAGNFKICKSSVGNAVGNSGGNSVGNVVGNAAGNAAQNLVGNGCGNDAVF